MDITQNEIFFPDSGDSGTIEFSSNNDETACWRLAEDGHMYMVDFGNVEKLACLTGILLAKMYVRENSSQDSLILKTESTEIILKPDSAVEFIGVDPNSDDLYWWGMVNVAFQMSLGKWKS